MLFAYTTTFSLIEWLAITGLCQGVLILVYISFRVRSWRQASLAVAYFLTLVLAFGLQFALRLDDFIPHIRFALWAVWSMGPPLCYLLSLQAAQMRDIPPLRHFCVLLFVPLAVALAFAAVTFMDRCDGKMLLCGGFFSWLYLFAAISGACSMLLLFFQRGFFTSLWQARGGRERYWLVLTLVAANIGVTLISLARSTGGISAYDADALLVVMGIAFIYLATTTLFRVYPPPVQLTTAPAVRQSVLTTPEKELAARITQLMELDKLYHEQTFSRADLARELGCSEHVLSRVINSAFGKSFPRLLSEYRVEDAKRMLADPAIPVQVVAAEVGFNSLASFNRVFREITGKTPTAYRAAIL